MLAGLPGTVCQGAHCGTRAFTLVELLVVITIIGILASLITVAAVAALEKAHGRAIKAEIDSLSIGLPAIQEQARIVSAKLHAAPRPEPRADLNQAFVRHIKKAFPRNRDDSTALQGNVTAAEAVVLWLGGFSADPERPFTGPGGPAYPIEPNATALFEFDETRLGPRNANGDPVPRTDVSHPEPSGTRRQIHLYTYTPSKLQEPYVYFDTSRFIPLQAAGCEGTAVCQLGRLSDARLCAGPAVHPQSVSRRCRSSL